MEIVFSFFFVLYVFYSITMIISFVTSFIKETKEKVSVEASHFMSQLDGMDFFYLFHCFQVNTSFDRYQVFEWKYIWRTYILYSTAYENEKKTLFIVSIKQINLWCVLNLDKPQSCRKQKFLKTMKHMTGVW